VVIDTISETSAVYLDSNSWIHLVEDEGERGSAVARVLQRCSDVGASLASSIFALAECTYKPARSNHQELLEVYGKIFSNEELSVLDITNDIVLAAARCGGALGLKLADAIHYVSAVEGGCTHFLTSDRRFRSSARLEVIALDSLHH
jgi:predicted nucleic acid-binding protein